MGITITLDNELVNSARSYSTVLSRSVPKQIEHWAKIGRILEDNPDLSCSLIKGVFLSIEDIKNGNVEEYHPDLL